MTTSFSARQNSIAARSILAVAIGFLMVAIPDATSRSRVCVSLGNPPTLEDFTRDANLRREALMSLEEAQAIFVGEALSSSETAATFKVTRVWRGDLTTPLTLRGPVEIRPDGNVWTSDIAGDFKIGTSYLVFAYGPSLKEARPSACSTTPASQAREAIRILDFLTKPYPPKKAIGF